MRFLAKAAEFGWDIGQRDIFLQKRRGRSAGDVSNFFAGGILDFVIVARNATFHHFKADQRAFQRRGLGFFQGGASDEVGLIHFAEAVESGLPHIDGVGDFVSVKRQFRFEAQRVS